VSFNDSVSVTDDEAAGSTSSDGAQLWSSLLEQFDAELGVLTGATINLVSTLTQSVTVSTTAAGRGQGVGNGGNSVTSTGSGSSSVNMSAPGIDYTFSPAISASGSCTALRQEACSRTTIAAGVTANQNVAVAGSLDSYVGTGTVTLSGTAATLSATHADGVFAGDEMTQYDLSWSGDLGVTYSYLLHAAPSFDAGAPDGMLILDFGTVVAGSAVSPLGFSIFNLAADDRVALDLDGFSLTGGSDSGALDSDLAAFTDLAQGGEQAFLASFDTANVGSFLEIYTLTLSDADIGAAASRSSYTLELTLRGEVIASTVPVPDAVWLFGSGLLGLAGIARRHPS
jgi:hypothetical protein